MKKCHLAAAVMFLTAIPAYCGIRTVEDVDKAAERLKKDILSAGSSYSVSGHTYYVSADGDDTNDGLSPERAFRSLDKVNSRPFNPGDAVLFRRGDIWRGQVRPRSGVNYSAYGKGAKPCIYGSPWDGAKEGEWLPTDAPYVYVYSKRCNMDVGTLVFDEGEKGCAFKVIKKLIPTGDTFHIETDEPFEDYADLHRDLDMYHDYSGNGGIYLCSTEGNPAERFKSIEFLVKRHCFRLHGCNDVHIDNFCIKYTGSHGIGSSSINGLEVTNCEFGWIGGSIQHENPASGNAAVNPTRYGNAVEIWGTCDRYVIDHCWVYQVYDAALTFQWRVLDKVAVMSNIRFSNNLVENCVYSIEYFLSPSKNGKGKGSTIRDVEFCGNILRRAGYGWGCQRPNKNSPASIKAWRGADPERNKASNFSIHDNIIDRGTPVLLDVNAGMEESLPVFSRNVYLQSEGVPAGTMHEKDAVIISVPDKR